MPTPIFHETQRIIALMIATPVALLIVVFGSLRRKARRINAAGTPVMRIISLVVVAFIVFCVETLKMETIFYPDRIEYGYSSFLSLRPSVIKTDSIKSMAFINVRTTHYGNSTSDSVDICNAAGNDRLLIRLTNGKRVELGTQKVDELKAVLGRWYGGLVR